MSTDEGGSDSGAYPSVGLAYEIALNSYEQAEQRWDAVHHRIDLLLSFVTTLTVAAPVAAEAVLGDPDFSSPLLFAAGSAYIAVVAIALLMRGSGSILQVSPKELYERWLHLDEVEFKIRIIYWAGAHFDHARRLTYRKVQAANAMALLFILEALLFVAWIAAAT